MRLWIRRLHMYAGLLTVSSLLVYSIVGMVAMMEEAPAKRPKPQVDVTYKEFTVPQSMDDASVARQILSQFAIPLANPIPDWAIKHDKENNLLLDYYSVNGMTRVTVLEKEKRLKWEKTNIGFLDFLNRIHATTIRAEVPDFRVRGWIYYNEFSIWSMIFMTFSGLFLWLSSRPGWGWAQVAFASGLALFCGLYWMVR